MKIKVFVVRIMETLRLMIGVGSYQKYCAHMQQHHSGISPMTEVEYFRYGQNARYPSKDSVIKRCPC